MHLKLGADNTIQLADLSIVPDWFEVEGFTVEWTDELTASYQWTGSEWTLDPESDAPPAATGSGTLVQNGNSVACSWSGATV